MACLSKLRSAFGPAPEYQAVLYRRYVQHPIQIKARRLDFGTDLFLGHAFRLVLWPEGMAFCKFDYYQTPGRF